MATFMRLHLRDPVTYVSGTILTHAQAPAVPEANADDIGTVRPSRPWRTAGAAFRIILVFAFKLCGVAVVVRLVDFNAHQVRGYLPPNGDIEG
jgi:hypothetical protein